MRPPDARRATAPGKTEGGDKITGQGIDTTKDTESVKFCPLSCSPNCPWRCPGDVPGDEVVALVDEALRRGEPVVDRCRVLVPDVFAAECVANGHAWPDTQRVRRADGRSVSIYRTAVTP